MKYWFIEGQTHFGVPRGPKMSLAIIEAHEIGYYSSFMFTLPPSIHPSQVERNLLIFYATQPVENYREQNSNEKAH